MRATVDQIKNGIVHPQREARRVAVEYFSDAKSLDPGIMSRVIDAVETYGWDEAFSHYYFLKDLAQTDQSIAWLIKQIGELSPLVESQERRLPELLFGELVHTDVELLKDHEQTLLSMEAGDEKSRELLRDRIRLASLPAADLWDQLQAFCERSDKLSEPPKDLEHAQNVAEALSRHPEFCVDAIQPILAAAPSDNWLELFAVTIAGDLRLESAIEPIVLRMAHAEGDDWMFEAGQRALSLIGGDRVVTALESRYAAAEDLKFNIPYILKHIHTDLSVEAALRLFAAEIDSEFQCQLLEAVLGNFASEGIETARQFIPAVPLSPEVLEIRQSLLAICQIMDTSFPEQEAWTEDAQRDAEIRRNWYRSNSHHSADELDFDLEDNFEDDDEEGELIEDDWEDAPSSTIVQHEERVGRNDPCPCGSGKKFKKCCLNKTSPRS